MNNEATHVKTQEDYSKFSSIVNEFLQEQMNEDFMEKNLLEAGVTSLQMMRISNALRKHGYKMFAAFVAMLNELVSVKDWNKYVELLPDLAQERGIDNITEYYGNGQLLHSAFFVNAVKKKNQIAIIDENDGRNYTYEEVANKAKRVSSYLKEQGVAPGDLLAVSLSRGINQIISILGILAAGAGYIPINVNQPLSRRERIYSKSDIKFAITDTRLKKELEWPETVTVLDVMEADAYEPLNTIENYPDSNTAYVIFTSGSTGEPKGVEIAHFAAVNTIETINTWQDILFQKTGTRKVFLMSIKCRILI